MQTQQSQIAVDRAYAHLEDIFGLEHQGPHTNLEDRDAYAFEKVGALVARASAKVPTTFRFLMLKQKRH